MYRRLGTTIPSLPLVVIVCTGASAPGTDDARSDVGLGGEADAAGVADVDLLLLALPASGDPDPAAVDLAAVPGEPAPGDADAVVVDELPVRTERGSITKLIPGAESVESIQSHARVSSNTMSRDTCTCPPTGS